MNGIRALQSVMRLGPPGVCDTVSGAGEDLDAGGRAAGVAADRMRREFTQ